MFTRGAWAAAGLPWNVNPGRRAEFVLGWAAAHCAVMPSACDCHQVSQHRPPLSPSMKPQSCLCSHHPGTVALESQN